MTDFFCPDGGYMVAIRKMYYVICWFPEIMLHLTIQVVAKIQSIWIYFALALSSNLILFIFPKWLVALQTQATTHIIH